MISLTYGELKQGLICCSVYRNCTGCPLYHGDNSMSASVGDLSCSYMLMSAAMNCINVMEKDLEEANGRANAWEALATKYEQTIIEFNESFDKK